MKILLLLCVSVIEITGVISGGGLSPPPGLKYKGCFIDDDGDRDFTKQINFNKVIPKKCVQRCKRQKYKFAAVQAGNLCFCSNEMGKHGEAPETDCNMPCDFKNNQRCGGPLRNDVYKTGGKGKKGKKGKEGVCGCYGDPHCKTFDGTWVHYQGRCRYIMLRDNCAGPLPWGDTPTFEVAANFWTKDKENSRVAWVKEAHVRIGSDTFVIEQEMNVTVNGQYVDTPYVSGDVTIERIGGFMVLRHAPSELEVLFDGQQTFETTVSDNYNGQTCGFCGNKNENEDDDMMLGPTCKDTGADFLGPLTDSTNKFGVSWTDPNMADYEECANCNETPPPADCANGKSETQALNKCKNMFFKNKAPMKECWEELTDEEQDGFLESCAVDYCNIGQPSLCEIFVGFADYCVKEVEVVVKNWGPYNKCKPKCKKNEEFLICGNRTNEDTCYEEFVAPLPDEDVDDDGCTSGCFCKEGFLRNNKQKCVTRENCGCVYGTRLIKKNKFFFDKDECKIVKCEGDQITTIKDLDCDENASCKKRGKDNVICKCDKGYVGDGETCDPIDCGDVVDGDNMSHTISGTGVGAVATFECDAPFEEKGKKQIECKKNGKWTNTNFRCIEPKCKKNEEYLICGNRANEETCPGIVAPLSNEVVDADGCTSGCFCKEGFVRNDKQKCVARETCGCVYGTRLIKKNKFFFDKDECKIVKCEGDQITTIKDLDCDENASCKKRGKDNVICKCDKGYVGDGETCEPIDCGDVVDGDNMSHTIDGAGVGAVATFVCDPNFKGKGKTQITCKKNGKWSHTNFRCIPDDPVCHCPDRSECIHEQDGSFTCKCIEGYMGDCEQCVDVDECAEGTYDCPRHTMCVNVEGSYTCECDEGFDGDPDEDEPCQDVNECAEQTDNCPEDSACINMLGTFECICCDGYEDDGNGECVESDNEYTTGQKCCVCAGSRCEQEGQVCGDDGTTYDSWADLKITECEEDRTIGVVHNGPCDASCNPNPCCQYEKCEMQGGQAVCTLECSSSDDATGPVCSDHYNVYDNLCHFKQAICRYGLSYVPFDDMIPCEGSGEDLLGEWSPWGDCSVTCGKGVKSRTRTANRELEGEEVERYPLEETAFCYNDACPGGPCDGHNCDNDAEECFVNPSGDAECECPRCRGLNKDPVCGLIGNRTQTFRNLCRLQRRACKRGMPFEPLYFTSCTDTPSVCSLLAKLEIVVNDDGCETQGKRLVRYCGGGCGDNPDLCCEPTQFRSVTYQVFCNGVPTDYVTTEPSNCGCT